MGVGWYRRTFEALSDWSDCAVRIEFESVFHTATVWINGTEVGRHNGKGYTAFAFEITKHLRFSQPNTVVVRADNHFDESMLPRGRSSDWAHDGGIYRPVQLLITPKVFIERVAIDADPDLTSRAAALDITAFIRNTSASDWEGRVGFRVTDAQTGLTSLAEPAAANVFRSCGSATSISCRLRAHPGAPRSRPSRNFLA